MVCTQFPPVVGGVANYVFNLSRTLVKKGHTVTVITRGSSTHGKIKQVEGIRVIHAPFLPIYPIHSSLFGASVNSILHSYEKDFDIIHAHSPLSPPLRTKLPIIVTMHTTGIEQVRYMEVTNAKSFLDTLFFKSFRLRVEKQTLKKANLVTSVSHKVAEELEQYYHVKKDSVVTIGNGVDTRHFFPPDSRSKKLNILYSGRLGYRKGLVDLVKSAELIIPKHPEVNFVFAGKGPFEHALKTLVESSGYKEHFQFLGFVESKELLQCYQSASMFVLPSHYEGLPTVLLEAMASGLPVIATDVGGVKDVVLHGKNGLIIPVKDSKAIAYAILRLLDEPELRLAMGKFARETIENHYDWSMIANSVVSCYQRLDVNK
ncbi:MAG: glycosyltransferase family 4 protein [Bacillota bacterium]